MSATGFARVENQPTLAEPVAPHHFVVLSQRPAHAGAAGWLTPVPLPTHGGKRLSAGSKKNSVGREPSTNFNRTRPSSRQSRRLASGPYELIRSQDLRMLGSMVRFRKNQRRPLAAEQLEPRRALASDLAPPPMALGMNLESVVDWSPAWTFTDAFKTSRPWISHAYNTATGVESWEGGGAVQVDAQGWPTTLNQFTNSQGQLIQQRLGTLLFRDIGTDYPAGIYRAQWQGTGNVSFGFAATAIEQGTMPDGTHYALLNVRPSADGIHVKVSQLQPSDPIRNIHVWMPDYNGQSFAGQVWQPGANFSPFHPLFLQQLAPFKTLRFMDWAETNGSDITTWNSRRPLAAATQQSGTVRSGVALEYMIELANELDADPWFNMPHQASDDFVRNFAIQVRDTLEPGRKIYVEWSNETWNSGYGFEVYPWINQQLTRPENADLQGDRWALVARETRRDFAIWSEVFAGQNQRLTRVVAGQQANSWIAQQIASHMDGQLDAISAAAYAYVSDMDRASFRATTTSDQVIDALLRNLPTTFSWLAEHRQLADQLATQLGRPIEFVSYEGGPHLDSQGGAYEPAFFAAGSNPRMYDVYTQLLAGAARSGVSRFVNYNFTGGRFPSSFGSYGALQALTQPLSTAPKYRALGDYAQSTPTTPPTSLPEVAIEVISSVAEEAGGKSATWKVTRSGPTTEPLTVNWQRSGSASATDYSALADQVTIAAGQSFATISLSAIDDSLVEPTEQLTLQLTTSPTAPRYSMAAGRGSITLSLIDNDQPTNTPGLLGEYFDNRDFTNLALTRIDSYLNFNWGLGSPDPRVGRDTFSIRWSGQLRVPQTGNYTFRTYSDEGIRLTLNGTIYVNNWKAHTGTHNTSASVPLTAGQLVNLQLDYFENTGRAAMRLEWRRPGQVSYGEIPPSALVAPVAKTATASASPFLAVFASPATISSTPEAPPASVPWGSSSGVTSARPSVPTTKASRFFLATRSLVPMAIKPYPNQGGLSPGDELW